MCTTSIINNFLCYFTAKQKIAPRMKLNEMK